MSKVYDVIILGGGPSGLTAAIYTSRADLGTLVLAGNPPGGQLMLTTEVENYPGFPEGIMGPELVQNFRVQAERFDAEVSDENAVDVRGNVDEGFRITTDSGNEYHGRTVIVATGASARWLELPSEQKLRGKGVSACATCDGFFFKNKVVAVVGGGDAALEEATFLTKFATKIYIIVRGNKDNLRASKIMQKRAFENPKIEFIFNSTVTEVLGENAVSGLVINNSVTGEDSVLSDVEGLFVAIGHTPNTAFLKNLIDLDAKGYAVATEHTYSSISGIFIAGDVYDHRYRQAITAAGFGCMAALDVEKFISEHFNDTPKRSMKDIQVEHWEQTNEVVL